MVARRVLVVAAVTATAFTPVLRLTSTRGNRCAPLASTPDDDDDDEYAGASQEQLAAVAVKEFEFENILSKEEAGELDLRPIFQRGFKWTQKQSSLWIESILRGYPCLPEIVLLDTDEGYAVFDGQQRLTSTKLFIKGERAPHWKATAPQRKAGTHGTFALEGLPILKDLEGKTFKDLDKKQQRQIKSRYGLRCAVIPASWQMTDYLDFFKRIQGGGTPMTDQELRRAISRGPFTTMLDGLADGGGVTSSNLARALGETSELEKDEKQELLLRYFALQCDGPRDFYKPSMKQHALELMKRLNKGEDDARIEEWRRGLDAALELAVLIFPDPKERFRRAVDGGARFQTRTSVQKHIWDTVLYCLSRPDRKAALVARASEVRAAFVDLMVRHPAFETLTNKGTEARVAAFEDAIQTILAGHKGGAVSRAVRVEMIEKARRIKAPCPLCGEALGPSDDLLHIDHIVPLARGGRTEMSNLQVVHRICNQKKGAG
ncbi:unnamed protein product [Pelagomonas calceolata]|uniref:HNH nuclease domain-containing protein n=1 Tax=Pelagomonas calceolata TaxID=35677 RepID=A0A8J2SG94_9STRA|nr:unnamed protein product [Pelagomonas calceolata]